METAELCKLREEVATLSGRLKTAQKALQAEQAKTLLTVGSVFQTYQRVDTVTCEEQMGIICSIDDSNNAIHAIRIWPMDLLHVSDIKPVTKWSTATVQGCIKGLRDAVRSIDREECEFMRKELSAAREEIERLKSANAVKKHNDQPAD